MADPDPDGPAGRDPAEQPVPRPAESARPLQTERQKREAAALRENLLRRKAGVKARTPP